MTFNTQIRLTELKKQVKTPDVAGYFYPSDANELQQMVSDMLTNSSVKTLPPKALVAPHAGYIYSGPIAANAYASLIPVKSVIKRVVLLGPAHRVHLQGMAISSATHFATPLGEIKIDKELNNRISSFPQISIFDKAFIQEHSLEVHLPFLQSVLEDFSLLPIVVGDTNEDQVAEVLEAVWGGDETLIVVSSDLSHYHDYQTAKKLDLDTADAIQSMQYEKLGPHQACGCRPVSGLLKIAKQKNLNISILDVRNSGDTAGSHNKVVGYGAFSFWASGKLNQEQQKLLLEIAYSSIEYGFINNEPLIPELNEYPQVFTEPRGLFVTLTLNDILRGCIGNIEAVHPLAFATAKNAYNAAFCDPRFSKLSRTEFNDIDLSISILSPKKEIYFDTESDLLAQLRPAIDGLIISSGNHTATFLPAVWDKISSADIFLTQLKLKAEIKSDDIPERAWIYQSDSYGK
ncbi:MAG: AmmeMemoRadiSam system protein B/AmmeMemoRadiSam system protein A [Gammaproteobacteria bacterium]|jgi:AmmeMemoRadiSam system protein B/AmmeMemoRadiSam system protein A